MCMNMLRAMAEMRASDKKTFLGQNSAAVFRGELWRVHDVHGVNERAGNSKGDTKFN